jgi:5-methylcytosine-specific restriction endonuclease McrBC regulatory subunit McrC
MTVRRTSVLPDYVLQIGEGRLILDAKYKDPRLPAESSDEVLDLEVANQRSIRVHRSDIYQVVAYAQHARYGPAAVARVYPVVLQRDQQLPAPHASLVSAATSNSSSSMSDTKPLTTSKPSAQRSLGLLVTRVSRLSPSQTGPSPDEMKTDS